MHRCLSLARALQASVFARIGPYLLVAALLPLPVAAGVEAEPLLTVRQNLVQAYPPRNVGLVAPGGGIQAASGVTTARTAIAQDVAEVPCNEADHFVGLADLRSSGTAAYTLLNADNTVATQAVDTDTDVALAPYRVPVTGNHADAGVVTASAVADLDRIQYRASASLLHQVVMANGQPAAVNEGLTSFRFTATLRSEIAVSSLPASNETRDRSGEAYSSGAYSYTFSVPDAGTRMSLDWKLQRGIDGSPIAAAAGAAPEFALAVKLMSIGQNATTIFDSPYDRGGKRLDLDPGRYLLVFTPQVRLKSNEALHVQHPTAMLAAVGKFSLALEYNACTHPLEIVDPNPALLVEGILVPDLEKLAVSGRRVGGAAADGVTRLLLRQRVASGATILLCITGGTTHLGTLTSLDGKQRGPCIAPELQEVTPKEFFVFAIYQAPEGLAPGDGDGAQTAELVFRSSPNDPIDKSPGTQTHFVLRPPPILFVHDAWSGPAVWHGNAVLADSRYDGTLVDYSRTRSASLDANTEMLRPYVRQALTTFRRQGFAATQVDVIAHGEGGLLARLYAAGAGYKRNDNYQLGDFHKLMTLNTPHTGSFWASRLVDRRGTFPLSAAFEEAAEQILGVPLASGVIPDLAEGSPLWGIMLPTDVRVHTFAGEGGPALLGALGLQGTVRLVGPIPSLLLAPLHDGFADPTSLFVVKGSEGKYTPLPPISTEPNDLSSLADSAFGSVPGDARTSDEGIGSIYSRVIGGSSAFSDEIFDLLQQPITMPSFHVMTQVVALEKPAVSPTAMPPAIAGGITLTVSAVGPIGAGKPFSTTVETDPALGIAGVFVVGANMVGFGGSDPAAPGPISIEMAAPRTQLGEVVLTAYALTTTAAYVSAPIHLQIVSPAPLQSLAVLPGAILLTAGGQTQPLHVMGEYADVFVRNLSGAEHGTQYVSSDPAIVSVSNDGLLTAESNGVAAITAVNGPYVATALVEVAIATNRAPTARDDIDNAESGKPKTILVTRNDTDEDGDLLTVKSVTAPAHGIAAVLDATIVYTSNVDYVGADQFTYAVHDGNNETAEASVSISVTVPFSATSFSIMPIISR